MNDDRPLLLVLLADITQIKALCLCEIHLVGSQCKLTTNGAPNLNIDFGAIKRRFVFHFHITHTHALQHFANHVFGFLPQLWHIDILLTQLGWIVLRKAHHVFINAKLLKVLQVQCVYTFKLFLKLFFCTIDVGVVHLQAANTHQTKQLPTLLITITSAIFGKAQWQFLVCMRQCLENFVVVRTVHRLQVVFLPINFHGREHTIGIIRQVTALDVHAFLGDVW